MSFTNPSSATPLLKPGRRTNVFISNGQEAVGSSLLTGVFGLLFGYPGGLGTSRFVKTD